MGDFGSEKMRRDFRGPPPGCFDFLRGKCYRGASCRYLHHDSSPSNPPKRNRNKRELFREIPPDLKNSIVDGDAHNVAEAHDAKNIGSELDSDGHDMLQEKGKIRDMQTRQDFSVGSIESEKDKGLVEKTETSYVRGNVQLTTSSEIDRSLVAFNSGELGQSQGPEEEVAVAPETHDVQEEEKEHNIHLQEKQDPQQPLETLNPLPAPAAETVHSLGDIPGGQQTGEISAAELPPSNISCAIALPEVQSDVPHPLHVEGSSLSSSSPSKTFPPAANSNETDLSQVHPNQVPVVSPHPNQIPTSEPFPAQVNASEPAPPESSHLPVVPPKEFHPLNFSAGDFRFQQSQLPPPPYPLPQGNLNASSALQLPNQYPPRPPVANFQSQPFAVEGFPHQPHIADYHAQKMPPAKATWTDLPPPPPLPSYGNESTARPANPPMDFHPSQFQHNLMPSRGDILSQPFIRNHPLEEFTHSRVSSFQHLAFPHAMDSPRASLQMEEFRPKPLEADNRWNQPFRGPSFMGEERFVSAMITKSSEFIPKPLQDYHLLPPLQEGGRAFDTESRHSQPPTFSREPTSMHRQSYPGDGLPLSSFSREDFSSPVKNFSYPHWQQSSYDSQLPATSSFSSHLAVPGIVDSSFSRYPSGLSDVGSKVSTSSHYNPFASTFEQTPGSKFISSLRRESGSNYGSKLGQELTIGDQYDPLFDSIEPSSNMSKKFARISERDSTTEVVHGTLAVRAVGGTVPKLRPSSSHVPLDVEENNKQKEGVVTIIKPLENDDFDGAATDAEIGAVENESPNPDEGKSWSPGIANDLVNTGVGEIEIDQVQTSGKSKKNKDSRSMKLFKIAIADFVKEVLKPSWRQGNMSKEAFKTIVKKTVDKVSGAMQSHQIPKSQSKINQYVESSQRKLTKLVMVSAC